MSCRQLYNEPELHCVHREDLATEPNVLVRANEHNEEQQETCTRHTKPQEFRKGNLQCLLSVHVDDIKGTATTEVAETLLKHLNAKVGQCKADYNNFIHTGIQQDHTAGQVFIHQYVYIDSITPIGKDDEALCDPQLHEAFSLTVIPLDVKPL